ncbi:MAG: site-specific DNA-methyltransferase [Pseudorhodoplanes sp.]|nr:site-specific DNA-methyltransferase [Pseudorhodoplanes sp.]
MAQSPGRVRDSILGYLSSRSDDASVAEICRAVTREIGDVSNSSVRSYLNLNVPDVFRRTGRGRYRLKTNGHTGGHSAELKPVFCAGRAKFFHADCFDWLAQQPSSSIHAVVTDPPYGLVEYSEKEQIKLKNGKGGVWRIPPSFDGHKRAPLPRFTILTDEDRRGLYLFFRKFGAHLSRVAVPGANIMVASNPLLSHIVASSMSEAGLELRGTVVRLVMTMRGGDRPKNAHHEFDGVSVMPRSMWEPWVIFRRPLEGRVQDNLRQWKTGGYRRVSADKPFGDVIRSNPTSSAERKIAPHPSLKPQAFLRKIVRAALPLGEGIILDPFAGSGSTLAAANAVGYESIGVESSSRYVNVAKKAIPKLGLLAVEEIDPVWPERLSGTMCK